MSYFPKFVLPKETYSRVSLVNEYTMKYERCGGIVVSWTLVFDSSRSD